MAGVGAIKAGEAYVALTAKDQGLEKTFKTAENNMKQLSASIKRFGTDAIKIGTAITAPLVGIGKVYASLASDLTNSANKIGMNTTELQAWTMVAESVGGSVSGIEQASQKLNEIILKASQGSKEATDSLKEMGLSYKELQGLGTSAKLEKTVKALQGVQNETTRSALAVKVLGAEFQTISGKDFKLDLKATAGQVIDAEDVSILAALDDTFRELGYSAKKFGAELAAAFTPALREVLEDIKGLLLYGARLIDEYKEAVVVFGKLSFKLGGTALALGAFAKSWTFVSSAIGTAMGSIGNVTAAVGTLPGILSGGIRKAMQAANRAGGESLWMGMVSASFTGIDIEGASKAQVMAQAMGNLGQVMQKLQGLNPSKQFSFFFNVLNSGLSITQKMDYSLGVLGSVASSAFNGVKASILGVHNALKNMSVQAKVAVGSLAAMGIMTAWEIASERRRQYIENEIGALESLNSASTLHEMRAKQNRQAAGMAGVNDTVTANAETRSYIQTLALAGDSQDEINKKLSERATILRRLANTTAGTVLTEKEYANLRTARLLLSMTAKEWEKSTKMAKIYGETVALGIKLGKKAGETFLFDLIKSGATTEELLSGIQNRISELKSKKIGLIDYNEMKRLEEILKEGAGGMGKYFQTAVDMVREMAGAGKPLIEAAREFVQIQKDIAKQSLDIQGGRVDTRIGKEYDALQKSDPAEAKAQASKRVEELQAEERKAYNRVISAATSKEIEEAKKTYEAVTKDLALYTGILAQAESNLMSTRERAVDSDKQFVKKIDERNRSISQEADKALFGEVLKNDSMKALAEAEVRVRELMLLEDERLKAAKEAYKEAIANPSEINTKKAETAQGKLDITQGNLDFWRGLLQSAKEQTDKTSTSGTFLSQNIRGLQTQQRAAEKTAKATEETAKNTKKILDETKNNKPKFV